jgi:poly-gamma-glutamate synthesis protein (capsule biosynthesis protein)
VGNLEALISRQPAASSHKAYAVRLGPEALEVLRDSGFAAFNVANNHVYDGGSRAFEEMIELLGDLPELQIYGTRERPFAEFELSGNRIAIIGSLEPCRSRGPRLFREEGVEGLIRELRNSYSKVFVTPHWAKEGEFAHHPSPGQRLLARRWAQAGADGVFGHHTHTLHGRETSPSITRRETGIRRQP